MSTRALTQISLSYTPWRARGQHGTPPITEKRYCLCAYARAALHTSALSECCAAAVALQTLGGHDGPGARTCAFTGGGNLNTNMLKHANIYIQH